jgi:hypothetical protein
MAGIQKAYLDIDRILTWQQAVGSDQLPGPGRALGS